ncbi:hypothetical protein [Nocardia aurantiaca]|uniref:Secreted protein n=1 Tax=Nocardia aurantiaca TaxID=2675850 RepID=A0A6I3L0F4_9NOCA|nr:hypothetical protein [Nocardia aurantiaca]MTE13319.1 hypothetical protein [Nocardia aurantiaca]
MHWKALMGKGFGALALAATASLAVAATPASAAINFVSVSCPAPATGGACTQPHVFVRVTDPGPIWITVNGNPLGYSNGRFNPFQDSLGYYSEFNLDCAYTPFHIEAVEKDSNGVVTSNAGADYSPAVSAPSVIVRDLITGSVGAGTQSFDTGVANGGPANAAITGSSGAAAAGSAAAKPCQVASL